MADNNEGKYFEDDTRHRPINLYRYPKTDRSKQFLELLLESVQSLETSLKLRQRKRKEIDQRVFIQSLKSILCDVIVHGLRGATGELCTTMDKSKLQRQSRYKSNIISKTYLNCIKLLCHPAISLIEFTKGSWAERKQSTVKASNTLKDIVHHANLTTSDFAYSLRSINGLYGDECIILKTVKNPKGKRSLYDYADNDITNTLRLEMLRINHGLDDANLTLVDEQLLSVTTNIDPAKRTLKRFFTNAGFSNGGRMFGGFWIPMSKEDRFICLRIDGEEVVELDFKQMNPRLLYGLAGKPYPITKDAYNIQGLEDYRKGVKVMFNTITFDKTRRSRKFPKDVRKLFFNKAKVKEIVLTIEQAHPDITQLYPAKGFPIGYHLQFLESSIMVELLLKLNEIGITALPIHDAVLVPKSKVGTVIPYMEAAFHKHANIEGGVSVTTKEDIFDVCWL